MLQEVDTAEITSVVDNYIDIFLKSSKQVKRPLLMKGGLLSQTLVAEHGLSMLIKITQGSKQHIILMDAGWSESAFMHNWNLLGYDFAEISALVLSHGHMDHFGALSNILLKTNKDTPLILHPDAFLRRGFKLPNNDLVNTPILNKQALIEKGTNLVIAKTPTLLTSNLIITTGEVLRTTNFEKGISNAWKQSESESIEHDSIMDDQALIINLKNKGLVIISGCAHSGIINIVKQAKKISGVDKVYGIIGGLHLCIDLPTKTIDRTIAELKKINPEIIVPMHCVCRYAMNKIASSMPKQFVLNSVGTKYFFN